MKKIYSFILTLIMCAVLTSAVFAGPGSAPAEGQEVIAQVPEGESAEGESAASEGAEAPTAEAGDSAGDSNGGDSADGESAGESAEGNSDSSSAEGESAGGDMAMANGQANEETSVVVLMNGELEGPADAFGTGEMAVGGLMDGTTVSGVRIIGTTDESNGVFVKTENDGQITTIGGAEDYFDVEGIGSFNTVIDVYGKTDADPGTEHTYGTAITVNGGVLNIDNVYARTEGWRSGTLYTMSSDHPAVVVIKDSVLRSDGADGSWMPDAKLFPGSARNTLLLGGDMWIYNSSLITRDWGSISQDMKLIKTSTYTVNSISEAYRGGYTYFALDGSQNYIYGSRLVSAEYGLFAFCAPSVTFDSLDAVDEAALQHADGIDFSEPVYENGRTLLAGGVNAIVINSMSSLGPAEITVRNTTLSTMDEDITSACGNEMHFDFEKFLVNSDSNSEAWFYLANDKGAAITARSHGSTITLGEGTEIRSSTGVLLETTQEFDAMAGIPFHDSTDDNVMEPYYLNIEAPVTGDILHKDYMMDMFVNVSSEYTGRTVTGSITAWNNIWSKEGLAALLEQWGMTDRFELTDEAAANIRSVFVREEDTAAYTDVFGIKMAVAEGGIWNVQGESSVISLTVADGAAVNASEIYVDCAFGSDGYLDASTGTQVDVLEAGEYSNVVLVG